MKRLILTVLWLLVIPAGMVYAAATTGAYDYPFVNAYEATVVGTPSIYRADLPEEVTAKVQDLAVRSFVALLGEGMARVDFFVKQDGSVLVNELNTIPGFTDHSLLPKAAAEAGMSFEELVQRILEGAGLGK